VAEWKVLFDAVFVSGMYDSVAAQAATALRAFGLAQMASAGQFAQDLAASRDLEPLHHGLFGFDAFGTSHKSIVYEKERAI